MPPRPADERASRVAKRSPRYLREAKALGRQIRALREERGWTLEEAAEHMRVAPKHLQKVEAGLLNVTLVTLVRVAEGFGETVRNLFPLPEPQKKKRREPDA